MSSESEPRRSKLEDDQSPIDPAFAVDFLWDGECNEVSSGQLPILLNNVEKSLRTVDPRYYLRNKILIGNISLDFMSTLASRRHLKKDLKFKVVLVPYRKKICWKCPYAKSLNYTLRDERCYDVGDRLILEEILDLVLMDDLARNVLLSSGDKDFLRTVTMLRKHDYNVMLGINRRSTGEYRNSGNLAWMWERMVTGITSPL